MQQRNNAQTQATIGNFFDKLAATKEKKLKEEKELATDYEGSAYRVLMDVEAGKTPDKGDLLRAQAWDKMNQAQNAVNPSTGEPFPKNASIFGNLQSAGGAQYPAGGFSAPPSMPVDAISIVPQPMGRGALPTGGNMPYVDDIGLGNVNDDMALPPRGDNYNQVAGMTMPQRDMARGLPAPANERQGLANYEAQLDIAKEDAKTASKLQAEKAAAAPQAKAKMQDTIAGFSNIDEELTKAIGQTSEWTSGMGSLLNAVPGSDATDLAATLQTIQADSAFSALQNMRENSPTGGALGNVAVEELNLLKAAQAALTQSQSKAQLVNNLKKYQNIRRNGLKRVAAAYEQQYGETLEIPDFGSTEAKGAVSYEEYFK